MNKDSREELKQDVEDLRCVVRELVEHRGHELHDNAYIEALASALAKRYDLYEDVARMLIDIGE